MDTYLAKNRSMTAPSATMPAPRADRKLDRKIPITTQHLSINLAHLTGDLPLSTVDQRDETLASDVRRSRPALLLACGQYPWPSLQGVVGGGRSRIRTMRR